MASCLVLMLFIAILTILPGEKGVVLKLANVPLRSDHLKPKLSLNCRFAMKRKR